MSYLNVFTQYNAASLIDNCQDYMTMTDGLIMVVAHDNTVWVCREGESASLYDCTMIERIL